MCHREHQQISPIYGPKRHNNNLKTTNHETDYPFTHRIHRRKPHLYLSAPALEEVKLDGVGAFECEEPLKAEDIRFEIDGVGTIKIADLHCQTVQIDIDGVGKGNVNVYCDKLKARADGVSSLKLSGKARSADIKDGFLSKINDRRLKVEE